MLRLDLLAGCALPLVLLATPVTAQDLKDRPVAPPLFMTSLHVA